mgnify:FL=1
MLNDDQRAKMMESVTDFTTEPTGDVLSVDTSTGGSVQEIKTEDVTIEESSTEQEEQSVEVEASEDVADTDDSPQTHKGHNVPYKRFKSVLDARNNYRGEVKDYRSKITSLEQKLASLEQSRTQTPQTQPADQEPNWLDNYLNEDTHAAPEWQQQYKGLNDRLYQFEVAQEEATLKVELEQIGTQFPNVPSQLLLKAVIQDPAVDIFKLAEDYSHYVSGIEEGAIARYVKEGGQEVAAPALSRPHSSPSGGASTVLKPKEKPRSVKEATSALRDLMSRDNFLKK